MDPSPKPSMNSKFIFWYIKPNFNRLRNLFPIRFYAQIEAGLINKYVTNLLVSLYIWLIYRSLAANTFLLAH